jgi:transcriptional regulator with XRE-family HTH domain
MAFSVIQPYLHSMNLNPIYEKSDLAILEDLGHAIKKYRLARNLTQHELSEKAGLSRSTISDLENGKSINLLSLIQILRSLEELELLNLIFPEEKASPLELLKQKKQERKRASSRHIKPKQSDSKW